MKEETHEADLKCVLGDAYYIGVYFLFWFDSFTALDFYLHVLVHEKVIYFRVL